MRGKHTNSITVEQLCEKQIKEARKQAFLEAAEIVNNLHVAGKFPKRLWAECVLVKGEIAKLLREKAEE